MLAENIKGYFIAGTDTGVGKTFVTRMLIRKLIEEKISIMALKPVASGADQTPGGLRNEDAVYINESFPEVDYSDINPICFEPAIAPHLAAEEINQRLSVDELNKEFKKSVQKISQKIFFRNLLVEGAGGWLTPLNREETYGDWVKTTRLSVVLVVGMRLGCINHAMLTCESIINSGVKCEGWVANFMADSMPYLDENIQTLQKYLPVPLLANVTSEGVFSPDFVRLKSMFNNELV